MAAVVQPGPVEDWKQKKKGFSIIENRVTRLRMSTHSIHYVERKIIYSERGGWGDGRRLEWCPWCGGALGMYASDVSEPVETPTTLWDHLQTPEAGLKG